MFGSRNKGSVGEREVSKLLESWWGALEPEVKFVKTPLSGGWGGPSLRAGFKASGDLMTTAERFPFTVEVKRREGWTMERLVAGKASPVWGWWRQSQTQGLEMNAIPMLWIRKNREPWRIIVPWHVGEEVRKRPRNFTRLKDSFPVSEVFEWESWSIVADFGDLFPVMVLADSFLAIPPTVFATPLRRGKPRT